MTRLPEMPEMVGKDYAARAAWEIACRHRHGATISVALACDTAAEIRKEVRDALLYLFAEATEWKEDVDGDYVDGVQKVYVNHHIRIRDGLLEELLDIACIKKRHGESCLQALDRANVEDANALLGKAG